MEDFKKEAHELSTKDLLLILEDQVDLYTEEELEILREELAYRSSNPYEIEEEKERLAKIEREKYFEYQRKNNEEKINSLKSKGYEGYYEYTTLSLVDDKGGKITTDEITQLLNEYALDGWRLVSAYVNELGQNSTSAGFGGFATGMNSTKDQHILILERFVRI